MTGKVNAIVYNDGYDKVMRSLRWWCKRRHLWHYNPHITPTEHKGGGTSVTSILVAENVKSPINSTDDS